MSEEKDKDELKREAAARAKELAMKKLAERKAQAEASEALEDTQEDSLDIQKQKAAAAAKAKAAALAKLKSTEKEEMTEKIEKIEKEENVQVSENETDDLLKQKAIAAAKAKAAAAAKAKAAAQAKQSGESEPAGDADDAKAKAIAAAKAKAAAAAKAKAAAQSTGDGADDAKAKAIAAAKAKAAAAAKAKASGAAVEVDPSVEEAALSPNQVYLDKYVKVIEEHLGKEILEDSYLNSISKDVPTLVAKPDTYFKVAEFLKYNEQLGFDYLSEIHGSDFETHMEVYVHLYSYKNRQSVALKVKIDRNQPAIDSIQPLWEGANWPEREAYDLLGITFNNHPKLERILLPDDWVGHPLRKDYEQFDVEV